ncbi:MAG: bifunctional (p)ppGpp synthetase/guanosine-3',5'-bis(diphosphate) 3'-pyrophosphohydrolase [Burkholderiaceae bacterium]
MAAEPVFLPVADVALARSLVEPLYLDRELHTGEPFLAHAEGLAAIVRGLRDDDDLVAAAYLFGVPPVLRDPEDWLRTRFGPTVMQLVGDLRQLLKLSERTRSQAGDAALATQPEALRRMLLAMCNDLRVVLLRLASRLQTLRWFAASKRAGAEVYARETLAIYAPLANRLGIWQLKWELEDLALRFIEPDTYKRIARLLEEKRVQRLGFIDEAIDSVRGLLAANGVVAEVSGRPKHIYSIWNKMRGKGLAFDELYDVRALRVIVGEVAQCYEALSAIHANFSSISQEYDDYIARPKPNGYQSLHTVVRDAQGRPLEIQIRTRAMHAFAELGVAAHWRYKEGARPGADAEEERVAWLRQLLAWRSDLEPPAKPGAADARIYVLTPQGRVVELPAGATPIDFAFHLHSELGNRCRGARVNGAMVPLNTKLANGQTVEIVAAKTGGPSRDWLNPELGYLASTRSRTKVRQWFNAQETAQAILTGRERIDKELARLGKTVVKLEDLAKRLGFASVDDLCAAAGKDEFSFRSIDQALAPPAAAVELPPLVRAASQTAPKGRVLVVGVDSLLTQLARCCRPAPPDEIVGFVTRGRGVSIHRADCSNAIALGEREHERLIEVTWGAQPDAVYPVEIFVVAQDRSGLLRDISEVFVREKQNVIGVNTQSTRGDAHMSFTVEIRDAADLARTLSVVQEVPGVISARRR